MFKTSCLFFWLILLASVSWLFGLFQFQDKYTYVETKDDFVRLVTQACALEAVLAVLGSLFVKCDVSHICCSLFYILATTVGVTVMCAKCIMEVDQDTSLNLRDIDILLKIYNDFTGPKNELPDFLNNMEIHHECCGIWGFKDYRAFIFPLEQEQDIPYSCCNRDGYGAKPGCPHINDSTVDPRVTLFNVYERYPNTNINLTELRNNRTHLQEIRDRLYNPKSSDPLLKVKYYKGFTSENFYEPGCIKYLEDNMRDVVKVYTYYCISLIVFAFAMAVVFMRSCYKARQSNFMELQELLFEQSDGAEYVTTPHEGIPISAAEFSHKSSLKPSQVTGTKVLVRRSKGSNPIMMKFSRKLTR